MSGLAYRLVRGYRFYAPDADHAEVARWLRDQAMTGFVVGMDNVSFQYRGRCTCGVVLPEEDNSVSLIFTRDAVPGEPAAWHLSVCCITGSGYRGYQPAEGEHWAELIFGRYRSLVQEFTAASTVGQSKHVHHFRLDNDSLGKEDREGFWRWKKPPGGYPA